MKQIAPVLLVLLALVLVDRCAYSRGKRDASAHQRDSVVDSRIGQLAGDLAIAEALHAHERDSTSRVIQGLRGRVRVTRDTLVVTDTAQVRLLVARQDSLIATLDEGRRADSLKLLFWRGEVYSRDTIVAGLQEARNAYRVRAERPRYTSSDIAGGAVAGYGLAKESPEFVLAGAVIVVAPRLVAFVGRIF